MFFNDGKGTIYYGIKKYFRIYFLRVRTKLHRGKFYLYGLLILNPTYL